METIRTMRVLPLSRTTPSRALRGLSLWRRPVGGLVLLASLMLGGAPVLAAAPGPAPLMALPQLALKPYLGTWYQWALIPNRFQQQCVSDTTATYRSLPDESIEVRNRCRRADGRWDEAIGQARAVDGLSSVVDGVLQPAQLQVSFLPTWLRWTGIGWGAYWVIERPEHGRYAVVSEPSRQYLWVLTRAPNLSPEDEQAVQRRVQAAGFDWQRVQRHSHGASGT